MREIKFRAWDYNSIRYDVTGLECGANGTIGDWYSGVYLDGDYFSLNGDTTRTTKAILMQFTGLHDKHGKEVYEGDIITCWAIQREVNDVIDKEEDIITVKYSDGYFFPFGYNCGWRSYVEDVEIIGNIYENEDLLK